MLPLAALLALLACPPHASPASDSDDVEGRRVPWVHQELHQRAPQDFAAGTFVRGELGRSSGVRLSPSAPRSGAEDDGSAIYESAVLQAEQPFHELLASWNVDVPSGAGIWFELRAGRAEDGTWTDWLRAGEWGFGQPEWQATTESGGGKIELDHFRAELPYDRAQYRIVAWRGEADAPQIRVSRVDLTFSTRDGLAPADAARKPIPEASWKVSLPVPFRSQKAAGPKLAPRVCGPTALAMVMEFYGVARSTEDVAASLFDSKHGTHGAWTRAIQGAYTFGVQGYLTRFSDWSAVERSIAVGQPLVIAVASQPGEASGSSSGRGAGAFLVVTGFDPEGQVQVLDPAAESARTGSRVCARRELETSWLARGGTAYVLLSKR